MTVRTRAGFTRVCFAAIGYATIGLIEAASGSTSMVSIAAPVAHWAPVIPSLKTKPPTEALLHSFVGGDGANPESTIVIGANGDLYGTAAAGGNGSGLVYQLVPQSGSYTEHVVYAFGSLPNAADGSSPIGGLVADPSGALYGTTRTGGAYGYGVLFKLSPPASGQSAWTETIVHHFSGGSDGANPIASLSEDSSGGLYGTTQWGGSGGYGIAFRFVPPTSGQSGWTEYVLHAFSGGADGANPSSGILLGHAAVYGTTAGGGTQHAGVAYVLWAPTSGSVWSETVMYTFGSQPGSIDGANPLGGLIADGSGNLYGTTRAGGTKSLGTVFRLTPPNATHNNWLQYVLHSFNGLGPNNTAGDGANPDSTLAINSDGVLYGTTEHGGQPCGTGCGTIFSLTPPPAGQTNWNETSVPVAYGANPVSGVLSDGGTVYVTTEYGGSGAGVVFAYAGLPQ